MKLQERPKPSLFCSHKPSPPHPSAPTGLMASPTATLRLPTSSLPPCFVSKDADADELELVLDEEIPAIDFSLLTGGIPEERAQVIHDLRKACQDWGCFTVVNHGVPEKLMNEILDASMEFFNLSEEDKAECHGKHVLDPIRYGTSFNTAVDEIIYWRNFLKLIVHPVFNSPANPQGFRDATFQYCERTREMSNKLLEGIWESLQLEPGSMARALGLDSCFQVHVVNLYPPCPEPELAMGLPSHSDHGLLTVLLQNGVDGLQVKRGSKWIRVRPGPDSLVVVVGDQVELVSNGRYKSVLHRAAVNGTSGRMSVVNLIGPSPETLVAPAPELVMRDDGGLAAFRAMKYGDYVEYQQGNKLKDKSVLDLLRLHKE